MVRQRLWRSARGTLGNYRRARAARSRTELRPRRRWRRTRLRVSAGGAATAPPCPPRACAARRGGTRAPAGGGRRNGRLCGCVPCPSAEEVVPCCREGPCDTCGSPAGPCAHGALRALGKRRGAVAPSWPGRAPRTYCGRRWWGWFCVCVCMCGSLPKLHNP